jgi:hypothetical protein
MGSLWLSVMWRTAITQLFLTVWTPDCPLCSVPLFLTRITISMFIHFLQYIYKYTFWHFVWKISLKKKTTIQHTGNIGYIGQKNPTETGNIGYTRQKKTHNTICIGHHYIQASTNTCNVNNLNISKLAKSSRTCLQLIALYLTQWLFSS